MAGDSKVRWQSWTFPYVCMNKISLLKWLIVVAAPPFGWWCEHAMGSMVSSKFSMWFLVQVLRVIVFTIDSQVAAGASVCFSSGQLVTLFLCFPPSLQHGPWILMLHMTGGCFWVAVRSRIWLFVKICWRIWLFVKICWVSSQRSSETYMQQCMAYLLFQLLHS